MTNRLDEETALERKAPGHYVRQIEKGPYWGVVTPHGGYLMALMFRAMELEVGDPERRPRMLSQQFLGTIAPGPLEIRVTTERVGRAVSSLSARMTTGDRLVGLTTGIFTLDAPGPAFLDEPMPKVREIAEPDREMLGFTVAPVHEQFEFHRRFGSDGAVVPCEDGGWIVPKDFGPWDHRLALVASDVWIPPVIRHPDRIVATPSLHHVVHFGPTVGGGGTSGPMGTPLLVHHRLTSGGHGLTDEDISLWSEDGTLLLKARQLRAVVPTEKATRQESDA